jgi:hypothetical protein
MRSFVSRHPGWTVLIVVTVLFVAFLFTQSWNRVEPG